MFINKIINWKHYLSIVLFIFVIIILKIDSIESNENHYQSSTIINNGTISNETIKRNSIKFKPSVLGKCTRCRLMSNSLFEMIRSLLYDDNTQQQQMKNIDFISKIWNRLCFDIKAGHDDCRSFAEENYEKIYEWWNDHSYALLKNQSDNQLIIVNRLCIEFLKVCCPDGHYGHECKQCNGYPDRICSNNGKCAGSGTRLGNGNCLCNHGYTNKNCDSCAKDYFRNETLFHLNGTVQCLPCDPSCSGSCFDFGPKGCHVCRNGYYWTIDNGCIDIDECEPSLSLSSSNDNNPCPLNSFCINTDGSYLCYQCDPACNGCDGDGPDSCLKCADNHILKDGICINPDPKPLIQPYASPARYATYFGLCIVTCIIFRHNIFISSIIGLAVALYIMISEKSLETEYGRQFDKWWNNVFGGYE
ncbi:cysteine-rich with EGF-like domain protein 2 [Dermatophagoides pteronyssinus]|uniref:cysteine-rich with EGF-like domain protein 2 n=1 Tax=Dermatophagoides pteronyssinus TaxID=6956 RepID=UPI003F66209B